MNRTIKVCIGILITLFIGVFAFFTAATLAQTTPGLDVTLSPTVIELLANPGDSIHQTFRIRNNTSSPVDLTISLDKLTVQNGQVTPTNFQPGDSSSSWITFDKNTLSARPKEWTDIPFSVDLPKTAAFGYYYAIRIGPANSSQKANTPSAKLLGQVILPVLINVRSPGAKAELKIVNFSTPSLVEYLPATFSVAIKNTGNVYIKPRGNIFVQTSANHDIATLDVNPSLGVVLPGGTRTFTSDWKDGFFVREVVTEDDGTIKKDASGNPITHLTINWDKLTHFRIGKYSATVIVAYDNGKRDVPLEATTTFWVFPYKLIGGTLVGLIVLFFVGRFIIQWYIRREVNKYKTQG